MDCQQEKMLREVMAADFTLIELNLYLDTHPCDQRALALYCQCLQRAKMLRENYERCYGPLSPMSPYTVGPNWRWIEEPWPWQRARS